MNKFIKSQIDVECDAEEQNETSGSAPLQSGVMCRECIKAQVLLRLAMEAARGRLIDWTNKEHDQLFNEIEKYLEEHEPKNTGT